MMDYIPSLDHIKDVYHATSWTWFGASALLAGVGVLLVIVPVIRNIQAAVLCFALAAGTAYMGTLYTQRDTARVAASRLQMELQELQNYIQAEMKKAELEKQRKEKENADRITKAERDARMARAVADKLRGDLATSDTVMRHYRDLLSRRMPSPTTPSSGAELRQPGALPDTGLTECRSALQNLAADAAITNTLFVQCRESWPR